MNDMHERSLEEVLADFDEKAPLDRARTIPGSWYTDDRITELERKHVFGRSWQLVGREGQLQEPGRYLTAEVGGEPIVVVRGHDGVLRGFFNVCRHHAAAVMTECEGRADRMRCPYHGWTYALDGKLVSTTEFEGVRDFDHGGTGLVPVSVGVWEGLVFVHLDRRAAPLEEWLGERVRAEVAALGLGTLEFAGRRQWEIACNWKVFVDNYLDGGYHVPFLHRGLSSILSFKDYAIDCFDRVCLQSSPIEASAPGDQRDPMTASVRTGTARYYWLYPNLMLNWYAGYLDTNLVLPLGTDRVRVVFDFYFADAGATSEEARAKNLASMNVSERIQDEDHAICESVQRGLRSQAYEAGRLSVRREAGENLFHRLLAADLREGSRSLLRKRAPVL